MPSVRKPSFEEVKSWSDSFDCLMGSSVGQHVFRQFLRTEYNEANLLFFVACEELKKENTPKRVKKKSKSIYELYISPDSSTEVSIDFRMRENITRNMAEPTPHMFDEAKLHIYTQMHRDSYPRFLTSQLYKGFLQQ